MAPEEVEIVDVDRRAYLVGEVLDVDAVSKRCCVRYLREKAATWVEAARVSIPPQRQDATYRPRDGEWVEVAFKGEDGCVDAWWEGQISKLKGDFAYVTFPAVVSGGVKPQEVVELERLRPAEAHAPAKLEKRYFPLSTIKEGIDIVNKQLSKIAQLSGLLRLVVMPDGGDVMAIGTNSALETSTALINMMLLKVPHLVAAEARASALQARVINSGGTAGAEALTGTSEMLSFTVDTKSLGLLYGAKGRNIKSANSVPGVRRINVHPSGRVDIFAETQEAAEEAKSHLEVITDKIPLAPAEVGYIIGKSGWQIMELQEISACRMVVKHADGDGDSRLEVLGTRKCVDAAKVLIRYTIDSFHEQRDKQSELYALAEELRSISHSGASNVNASAALHGRGGRGRDRGQGFRPPVQAAGSAGATRGRRSGVTQYPSQDASSQEPAPMQLQSKAAAARAARQAAAASNEQRPLVQTSTSQAKVRAGAVPSPPLPAPPQVAAKGSKSKGSVNPTAPAADVAAIQAPSIAQGSKSKGATGTLAPVPPAAAPALVPKKAKAAPVAGAQRASHNDEFALGLSLFAAAAKTAAPAARSGPVGSEVCAPTLTVAPIPAPTESVRKGKKSKAVDSEVNEDGLSAIAIGATTGLATAKASSAPQGQDSQLHDGIVATVASDKVTKGKKVKTDKKASSKASGPEALVPHGIPCASTQTPSNVSSSGKSSKNPKKKKDDREDAGQVDGNKAKSAARPIAEDKGGLVTVNIRIEEISQGVAVKVGIDVKAVAIRSKEESKERLRDATKSGAQQVRSLSAQPAATDDKVTVLNAVSGDHKKSLLHRAPPVPSKPSIPLSASNLPSPRQAKPCMPFVSPPPTTALLVDSTRSIPIGHTAFSWESQAPRPLGHTAYSWCATAQIPPGAANQPQKQNKVDESESQADVTTKSASEILPHTLASIAVSIAGLNDEETAFNLCGQTTTLLQKRSAAKAAQPALNTPGPVDAKKLKAAVKEGGKMGVELIGNFDLGGPEFFTTKAEAPEGDLELLQALMDAANKEVDPTEEEAKGGSAKVGKMFLSAGPDRLALSCWVPKEDKAAGKTSASEWMQGVLSKFPDGSWTLIKGDDFEAIGEIVANKEAGRFPLKDRDECQSYSVGWLKEKGLFPDKEEEDDWQPGDEAGIEW